MKKFFESDMMLRIASLLMALLIWFAIRQITSYEETLYDIGLDVRHEDGWALEDVSVDQFQVTFRGSREDISRLKRESIRVQVDLRGQESPFLKMQLSGKHVIYPGVARVESISPDVIQIRMDQETEKLVPVKLAYTGNLAPGCVREAEMVQPPVVTVRGSAKQLDLIPSLQTAPIDLSGRSASFETRVDVQAPAGSWIRRIEPNRVLAQVTISHRVVEKTFDRMAVNLPPAHGDAAIRGEASPATVTVRAEADEDKAGLLVPESVEILLEPTSVDAEGFYTLRARTPDGVRVLEIIPQKVRLRGLPDVPNNARGGQE